MDINKIRQEFPTLGEKVHGKDIVYFDNAATSQKPQSVIDRINHYYEHENSNVHRGVHFLSQTATNAYEHTRKLIQSMINAKHEHEVIYTKGTTEGINLVAHSFGEKFIHEGDEIIISYMEHHSNIVPWQLLAERKKAILKVIPVNDKGELLMEEYHKLLSPKTKLVSIVHTSNSLGTINPVKEIIEAARKQGAAILIDGAQVVPHQSIDVQELEPDFLVFSGHKMFAPTGVGVLYGKEELLNQMPPYMGGGDMIDTVSFEKTTFNDLPHKFEAGTPNIAGVIGLGAGVEFINRIGYDYISNREKELLDYGTERFNEIKGMRIIGTAEKKASVISFLLDDIHPYDAGTILDQLGIAVRTGHHCTQPLMKRFEIPGTIRASFAFYNTKEEIDKLVDGLQRVKSMFGKK
ncbi:MAG: cysteine desulfurase [Bacteroidia bacterium]|nr:cysteine desulfurase [Bacteroidia bacterium]